MNRWLKKFLIILGVLIAAAAASCSREDYVPPESTFRHIELSADSTDRTAAAVRVDSVVIRDSVFLMLRGDTVVKETVRWRERIRIRYDTVFLTSEKVRLIRDSIDHIIPYPVVKEKRVEVEKPLTAWQKFRLSGFWVSSIALLLLLAYIFRKPLLRLLCRLRM